MDSFPFFQYASTLGIHTSLLFFTILFLPRTSLLYYTSPSLFPFAQPLTSLDKPQPPFLEPLTASPVLTLSWICLGTAVLVVWWSWWVRRWVYDERQRGSEKSDFETRTEQIEWQNRRLSELGSAALATLLVSFVYHFVVILFGAPLLSSHHLHTYLLSLQLSLLTVLPSAYVLGTPPLNVFSRRDAESLRLRLTWTRLFAELSPRNAIERAMVYPVIGTMVGCWCGCIPIALDWDRPWQAWPLTPSYGSVLGYVLGSLYALVVSSVLSLASHDDARSGSVSSDTVKRPLVPGKSAPKKTKLKAV